MLTNQIEYVFYPREWPEGSAVLHYRYHGMIHRLNGPASILYYPTAQYLRYYQYDLPVLIEKWILKIC